MSFVAPWFLLTGKHRTTYDDRLGDRIGFDLPICPVRSVSRDTWCIAVTGSGRQHTHTVRAEPKNARKKPRRKTPGVLSVALPFRDGPFRSAANERRSTQAPPARISRTVLQRTSGLATYVRVRYACAFTGVRAV